MQKAALSLNNLETIHEMPIYPSLPKDPATLHTTIEGLGDLQRDAGLPLSSVQPTKYQLTFVCRYGITRGQSAPHVTSHVFIDVGILNVHLPEEDIRSAQMHCNHKTCGYHLRYRGVRIGPPNECLKTLLIAHKGDPALDFVEHTFARLDSIHPHQTNHNITCFDIFGVYPNSSIHAILQFTEFSLLTYVPHGMAKGLMMVLRHQSLHIRGCLGT